MTPTSAYVLTLLAAGIGIPILAAMNAGLGQRIGAPFAAYIVLFLIALGCAVVVSFLTGSLPALAHIASAPKALMLAGVLVAFYVLSITWVAPKFGVGNAIFCVLLGQLLSAAVIDHFGLFGAQISPISRPRACGIGLMAAGVWLTQLA